MSAFSGPTVILMRCSQIRLNRVPRSGARSSNGRRSGWCVCDGHPSGAEQYRSSGQKRASIHLKTSAEYVMVMVYLCADAIKSQRYTTVRNKNFVVLEEFIDVESASGKGRTGFSEMLAFLQKNRRPKPHAPQDALFTGWLCCRGYGAQMFLTYAKRRYDASATTCVDHDTGKREHLCPAREVAADQSAW